MSIHTALSGSHLLTISWCRLPPENTFPLQILSNASAAKCGSGASEIPMMMNSGFMSFPLCFSLTVVPATFFLISVGKFSIAKVRTYLLTAKKQHLITRQIHPRKCLKEVKTTESGQYLLNSRNRFLILSINHC